MTLSKKEAKAIRETTREKLVYPTREKPQPRKKGKTFTKTELKRIKELMEMGLSPEEMEKLKDKTKPARKKKPIDKELKTKLEEQRKKVEAPERIKIPKMVQAKYEKDGKMVTEFVVAGDPKLKELAAIKRATIKPLSEAEIQKIQLTRVRQMQDIQAAAQLYQDQLKAQRFLASAYRGRIKSFPKHGFPISRIVAAYRKRKPTWRLRIRRDRRQEMVHLKIMGPANKLSGRDEVEREVRKILGLMNMTMHPSATIEDVRSPVVRGSWAYVNVKVRAEKVGLGEIRPRL